MSERFIVESELNPEYMRTGKLCYYYGIYNVIDTVTGEVVYSGTGGWGVSDAYDKRREFENDVPYGIVAPSYLMYRKYTDQFKLSRLTTRYLSRPVDAKGLSNCTVLLLHPVTELGLTERYVVDELLQCPSVTLCEVRIGEDWREVRKKQADSNPGLAR
jgi:hypothetical protein